MMVPMLALDDVTSAARRLLGVAHRTPVLRSRTLDELTGARIFLKAENLQRAGAFKFRGAYNHVSALAPAERERGVLTTSSGNHAQAVALAASLVGTSALIVMPHDAPASKLEATKAYGAEIVGYDRYAEDRAAIAEQLAEQRGLALVPPYDHAHVIAGQGTAAAELIEDAVAIDAILVPVGGGGLAAGTAIAASAADHAIRVIGVEPEAGDDTRRSLAAGSRVTIETPRTVADGQAVQVPGELTFEINRRLVDEVVLVSDGEIVAAMAFLFERMKLVAEPSGASALAALLFGRVAVGRGDRVGVVISGGNVDAARFQELLGRFDQRVT